MQTTAIKGYAEEAVLQILLGQAQGKVQSIPVDAKKLVSPVPKWAIGAWPERTLSALGN